MFAFLAEQIKQRRIRHLRTQSLKINAKCQHTWRGKTIPEWNIYLISCCIDRGTFVTMFLIYLHKNTVFCNVYRFLIFGDENMRLFLDSSWSSWIQKAICINLALMTVPTRFMIITTVLRCLYVWTVTQISPVLTDWFPIL